MKKIALIIITAFALNFALAMPALVANAEGGNINDMEFNVNQNLNLGDGKQEASYFEKDESGKLKQAPIVAFILKVIEFATYIIGSIAMILFIVSGFMFMTSQGNQQRLDEAKDIFKYTIIGLIIVFLSYIITIAVQSVFA